MAYQMTINLSEQEYAALLSEAEKIGKQPEILLHDFLAQGLQTIPPPKRPMTARELAELQYREGKLLNLSTHEPLTEDDQAERERLGRLFAGGKSMSDIVIEDRGPY